ncbi:MAG: hypothetical protein NW237_00090 [Cyanobacteriota bacterium]|nr:hypothetical protein [Cyanobacteriota bacterium]
MIATLAPVWNTEFEKKTLDRLIDQHAPHFPKSRQGAVRKPITAEETDRFYTYWAGTAALDLFIIQACAKGIGLIDDLEFQIFLTRQIGDDGAHAQAYRERIQAVTGRDPIEDMQREAKRQWDLMGDLPYRNWLGFITFEIHYELHVVPTMVLNSRLATIGDPELSHQGADRFLPDEALHREGVAAWWRKRYRQASVHEKSELREQLLALEEEGQQLRQEELWQRWRDVRLASGLNNTGIEKIYDGWRSEVIRYLFDRSVPDLSLVSDWSTWGEP